MSLFITFEGGEGSGKSTQSTALLERLQQAGVRAMLVHEPGTTPLGVYLRDWLKREQQGTETVSAVAELFLFEAARAELVAKIVKPALSRPSSVVIADRFSDSTLAYQGYGRRLEMEEIDIANRTAAQGVAPDLTFLLDCAPEYGLSRVNSGQAVLPLGPSNVSNMGRIDREGTRRFEVEPLEFHRRVRAGYLELAEQESERWRVIDATSPAEDISRTIWDQVVELMPQDKGSDAGGPLWAAGDAASGEGVD